MHEELQKCERYIALLWKALNPVGWNYEMFLQWIGKVIAF